MSRQISVNLDEGMIVLNDALKCSPLLDKIMVCKDCGRIHFLSPEQTGSCTGHKQQTLRSALEHQKNALKNHAMRTYIKHIVFTVLCLLAVWVLNIAVDMPRFGIGMLCYLILKICLAVLVVFLAAQIVFWVKTQKIDINKYSIYAFLIHSYVPKKSDYQGETWEHAIQLGFAYDIGALERWAQLLYGKATTTSEEWENLYAATMELSYCCDCEQLALLRLSCLSQMRQLPQSYTDIRQIIRVLPHEILLNWLEPIVCWLESLCVPCDKDTAQKFVQTVKQFCNDSESKNAADQQKKRSLLVRGMIAIGPHDILSAAREDKGLYELCQEAAKKDVLFAQMMKSENTAG